MLHVLLRLRVWFRVPGFIPSILVTCSKPHGTEMLQGEGVAHMRPLPSTPNPELETLNPKS